MIKKLYLFFTLLLLFNSCNTLPLPEKKATLQPEASAASADIKYMKRFFNNKSEWVGTTPGANEKGDVTLFVTKEWDSTEKASAFGMLPKDPTNQFSDWVFATSEGYIKPKGYIDDITREEEPFDLDVVMETSVEHRANVLFPHSVHTFWLKCDNCHTSIFVPEKNANPINMMAIIRGEFCGRCHGKVAFPITQCDRCHSSPKGDDVFSRR